MESNNNNHGKFFRNLGIIIGIPVLIVIIVWMFLLNPNNKKKDMVYSDYVRLFQNEQVEKLDFNLTNGVANILLKTEFRTDVNKDNKIDENDVITYAVPNVSLFVQDIQPYLEKVSTYNYTQPAVIPWGSFLPSILIAGLFVAMWIWMRRSLSG
ncbi:MAG: hypothetical protein J6Q42_06170, partial [Clostridia bacterium]|nr:hypothetical protein [Clostridia bacterium]